MNNEDISRVYLLGVPLENDYKNTLYFSDKSAQQTYFSGRTKFSFTDFSYQRKDNIIKVPKHIDDLWQCNYVMYQNTKYNNKWFYAFIKDMRFVSTGLTEIEIETDVMQTWMFDYTIKESFVEREHVDDDTMGKHTIPEGLETGEYKINKVNNLSKLNDTIIILATTIDPVLNSSGELIGGDTYGGVYNGVRTGYKYFTFKNDGTSVLPDVLKAFSKAGKLDAIGMMFLAPKHLVQYDDSGEIVDPVDNNMVKESYLHNVFSWSDHDDVITKLTTLDSYTPRNKKLLCYPYTYLLMSNNNGGNAIYHFEKFNEPGFDTYCDFEITSALTPSMDIIATPMYYNGSETLSGEMVIESLPAGKFPICGWSSDVYTNWLTQNAVNIATGVASGLLQIGGGLGLSTTGGGALMGASSIASGALSIASTLGSVYQHSLMPNQAQGNVNTGNVKYAMGCNTFTAYSMSIKQEYARIIDKYFDMFGYKVNLVKIPNKNHRSKWWYTKTIDINIDGSMPQSDLQKIKNCYNNGITFWKNASEIQNYSLSNEIV